MNDNQNAFVTRSTSRVLSEPGGKSSTGFLFGGSTTANKKTDKPASGAPPPTSAKLEEEAAVVAKEVKDKAAVIAKEVEDKAAVVAKEVVNKAAGVAKQAEYTAAGNFAQSEAARFKAKNEAQHFSLCGNQSSPAKNTTSSNAFTSAATTNSYNVITDRPTSRVVSVGYCLVWTIVCQIVISLSLSLFQISYIYICMSVISQLRPPGGHSTIKLG